MTTSQQIHAVSAWIDRDNAHRDPEAVTWARLAKVSEECGEVVAAYVGATGHNSRKGFTHTQRDVEDELLDVAAAALAAIAHLHGNDARSVDLMDLLADKVERVHARAFTPAKRS